MLLPCHYNAMPGHGMSNLSNMHLLLCSLKEGLIVVGILLGYLASYLFVDQVRKAVLMIVNGSHSVCLP